MGQSEKNFINFLKNIPIEKRAFTLVELLVVIAIVGLLSTIVLVSTSGLREQAKITKTLTWAKSIDSLLGADAVGIWNFDEENMDTCLNGKDVCDISGWNNHGTAYGDVYHIDNTPSDQGRALSFDGVDDYVTIDSAAILNVTHSITIGHWVWKPSYDENSGVKYEFSILKVRDYPEGLARQPYSVYVRTYNNGATYFFGYETVKNNVWYQSTTDSILKSETWNYLVASYSSVDGGGDGYVRLYVNGELKRSTSHAALGNLPINTSQLRIGGSGSMNGLIDEVRIYDQALTASQIQSQYYAGLNKLLVKGLMDETEYQEHLIKN
jgi:prepilin-type N-terminal cleavage/methylation domain-containing protein